MTKQSQAKEYNQKNEDIGSCKNLYTNVRSNIIPNSQEAETT